MKVVDPAGILPKLYNADIKALLRTLRYSLNWPLKIHFIPRGLSLEVAAIKFWEDARLAGASR